MWRDIFLRKPGTDIYIPQALGRAVVLKNMDAAQDFVFWMKKKTRKDLKAKKNTLSQRAESYFFTTEAAEVKRAGGNEKIARFDRSVRSSVK